MMASPKSSDEISTASGSGGRSASKNCPGSLVTFLPNWVSDWKRFHVETVLHIFYEENSSGFPPQLLEKIPKMKEITSQQKKYIEVLRATDFGSNPLSRKGTTCTYDTHYSEIMKQLDALLLEAKSKLNREHEESLLPEFRSIMHSQLREYVYVLKGFVARRRKYRTEQENEDVFKIPRVCEEEYSFITSAFAKLCGLNVVTGHQINQAKWINLRGNEEIISKPDFRFHATGQNFTEWNTNLLTVIEVKSKDLYPDDDEILKRKQQEQSEIRAKRRRTSGTYSSSSTSACGLQSSTVDLHACQTGGKGKPYIEAHVGNGTLGQHAGELLLDLNEYVKSQADIPTTSILYMPGMIVDHTTVYMTLLEISAQHFKKLTGTEQPLTGDDKATIYYSEPLDIMEEMERRILIGSFVNLNNIASLFK